MPGRSTYERVHDAADAYNTAYTEQQDYDGAEPRRGARVNNALDELKGQVDAAVAERDAEPEAPDETPPTPA